MCQSKKELRLIRGATVVCFLFGILGVVLSVASSSRSILFDGLRSFIQSGFILFSGLLLKLLYRGETKQYPFGYSAFEPFFIIIRVVILMSANIFLLIGSVQAIFQGGYMINTGIALTFAGISMTVCFAVYIVLSRNAKKLGSPMLKNEAISWLNDTFLSGAMLIALAVMSILERTRFAYLAPYTDPAVSIIFILTMFPSLSRQLISNAKELLNAAPPENIQKDLEEIIKSEVKLFGFKDFALYCTKSGRMISAIVYITLFKERPIVELDAIRARIISAMKEYWEFCDIDIVFSINTKWMDLNEPPRIDTEGDDDEEDKDKILA